MSGLWWLPFLSWGLIITASALQLWTAFRFYRRRMWVEVLWLLAETVFDTVFYAMGTPAGWWDSADTFLYLLANAVSLGQLLDNPPERTRMLLLCFWALLSGVASGEDWSAAAVYWTMCATQISYACILGFRYRRGLNKWQLIISTAVDILGGAFQFHATETWIPLVSKELADVLSGVSLVVCTWPNDYQWYRHVHLQSDKTSVQPSVSADSHMHVLGHPHAHLERSTVWTLIHMMACNLPTRPDEFMDKRRDFVSWLELLESIYPHPRSFRVPNPNPMAISTDRDNAMRAVWQWHNTDRELRNKPAFPWASYANRWLCPPMCKKRAEDLTSASFHGLTLPEHSINPFHLPSTLAISMLAQTELSPIVATKQRFFAAYRPLCHMKLSNSALSAAELLVYLHNETTYSRSWMEQSLISSRRTSLLFDKELSFMHSSLLTLVGSQNDLQTKTATMDVSLAFAAIPIDVQEGLLCETRIQLSRWYNSAVIDERKRATLQDVMTHLRIKALLTNTTAPEEMRLFAMTTFAATTVLMQMKESDESDSDDEDEKKKEPVDTLWQRSLLAQLTKLDILGSLRALVRDNNLGDYVASSTFLNHAQIKTPQFLALFEARTHGEAVDLVCQLVQTIRHSGHRRGLSAHVIQDAPESVKLFSQLDDWFFKRLQLDPRLWCHFQENGTSVCIIPILRDVRAAIMQRCQNNKRVSRNQRDEIKQMSLTPTLVGAVASQSFWGLNQDFWMDDEDDSALNYMLVVVVCLRVLAGTRDPQLLNVVADELSSALSNQFLDYWLLQQTGRVDSWVGTLDSMTTTITRALTLIRNRISRERDELDLTVITTIARAVLAAEKGRLILAQTLQTIAEETALWTTNLDLSIQYCLMLIGDRLNLIDLAPTLGLTYSFPFRQFLSLAPTLKNELKVRPLILQVLLLAVSDDPQFCRTKNLPPGHLFCGRLGIRLRVFLRDLFSGIDEMDIIYRTAYSLEVPYFLPQVTLVQIQRASQHVPQRALWAKAFENLSQHGVNAIAEFIGLVRDQRHEFFTTHMNTLVDYHLLPSKCTDEEHSKQRWDSVFKISESDAKITPFVSVTTSQVDECALLVDVSQPVQQSQDSDPLHSPDLIAMVPLISRTQQQPMESHSGYYRRGSNRPLLAEE